MHSYVLMILTYIEFEQAQWNQYMIVLGMVNRHGRYNHMICSTCGECLSLKEAVRRQVFLPLQTIWLNLPSTRKIPGSPNLVIFQSKTRFQQENKTSAITFRIKERNQQQHAGSKTKLLWAIPMLPRVWSRLLYSLECAVITNIN